MAAWRAEASMRVMRRQEIWTEAQIKQLMEGQLWSTQMMRKALRETVKIRLIGVDMDFWIDQIERTQQYHELMGAPDTGERLLVGFGVKKPEPPDPGPIYVLLVDSRQLAAMRKLAPYPHEGDFHFCWGGFEGYFMGCQVKKIGDF